VEIRRLAAADYTEITKLWKRANLPYKPKGRDSGEATAAQMNANPAFFLGAFSANRLVGTVFLSSDLRKGWINRLAVDPDYRRRGVAKALIKESERTLRDHGLRIFCSLIEDHNRSSKELFRKCGYTERNDISYFSKRDSDEV
jgi:ribosomal protein S18 acetylase RimI-like enzyme